MLANEHDGHDRTLTGHSILELASIEVRDLSLHIFMSLRHHQRGVPLSDRAYSGESYERYANA